MAHPLILTAVLDDQAARFFNEQRQRYFPAHLNYLDAHLTLFHHLPPDNKIIIENLEAVSGQYQAFHILFSSVVFTGRGVAYKAEAPLLVQLHKKLRQQWLPLLIPQDKQGLWPHITVQNKVPPEKARTLHGQLAVSFKPFEAKVTGLTLWEYLGGPWKHYQTFYLNE